jgi:adenine C2-methylase RlmN of 23S rRNA A2503 and tRNA A37
MKLIFCQFSNKLLNKDINSLSDKYYNSIYQKKESDGYYRNEHFFEIPLWIAEISGSIKDSNIEKELYIITNLYDSMKFLAKQDNSIICFSVLDINKKLIKEFAEKLFFKTFYIGGYIDFSYFNGLSNVKIFKTVKDLIESLNIPYEYNLDYSLFEGYKTIPRLTLSYGCLNRCKFCTVEKTIKEVSEFDILKQVESFKPLDFKLVYLNDKTFGQCDNYNVLFDLSVLIKEYNSNFKGFIIQTTITQILIHNLDKLLNSGIVFAIELGMETFNDSLLYELDKPQSEKTIISAIEYLINNTNVKIIPNILIGIIGENLITYNKTLDFLKKYAKNIYMLNIYNLVIYLDSPLSKEIKTLNDNDLNENTTDKSFYSNKQLKDNEYFYNEIFKLASRIL